jgi:hypothetical protein
MTSWLLKQETQTKTVQASAITPVSFTPQLQTQTKQIDETVFLSYPGQSLTVNVPAPVTRETVVSPILDLGASNILQGKQGAGTVESLSLLESQVFKTTQFEKSSILQTQQLFEMEVLESKTKTKTASIAPPIFQGLVDLTYQETVPKLQPSLMGGERVSPALTPLIISRLDVPTPSPMKGLFAPSTPIVPPKLFTLPKSGLGGLGPREPLGMFYPFGRQKRKYPVMTGGQVAKFLFSGKSETKRRKKK